MEEIQDSRFSAYRIYLLVFAVIAIVVLTIITFIRNRNQKLTAERQEYEYLRYFHSVLPQSNIYGDLKETLAKIERKGKMGFEKIQKGQII
jgi:Na+-translocating ferredoxin:NAD+ oxidoreductase RnfG subunit